MWICTALTTIVVFHCDFFFFIQIKMLNDLNLMRMFYVSTAEWIYFIEALSRNSTVFCVFCLNVANMHVLSYIICWFNFSEKKKTTIQRQKRSHTKRTFPCSRATNVCHCADVFDHNTDRIVEWQLLPFLMIVISDTFIVLYFNTFSCMGEAHNMYLTVLSFIS